MNELASRAAGAAAMLLGYALLCAAVFARERRRRQAALQAGRTLAQIGPQPAVLVAFASQTGQAEAIAWRTARSLHAAGEAVRVLALDQVDAALLVETRRALFIASTYGEGDPPDGASRFADAVMRATPSLPGLRFAVLALGSREYAHFCGFGRTLDRWLQATGATPIAARIDVDNGDVAALDAWQRLWGGPDRELPHDDEPAPAAWQLVARTRLNDGSLGAPLYELGFAAASDLAMHWESGDLAQLSLDGDHGRPRDYSIASVPADGRLELLVRQELHDDGSLGAASGLLTVCLAVGERVRLRVRPHRRFRLEDNAARPLILIGNGTGLAGLRGHLRARAAAGRTANWLLFGERQAAHDFLCRGEIERWQANGVLERLDMVFSRDTPDRPYVQHRLLDAGAAVREWVGRGAALYVCGSLAGMAAGVDAALREVLGSPELDELARAGRYRRDVY